MCVYSARALSRYSDMVDAMWREQRERLDMASDDARLRLSQWELPEALMVRPFNIDSNPWFTTRTSTQTVFARGADHTHSMIP